MKLTDQTLKPFPSLLDVHVLVVGDVMLDRYWHGPAERISPEAPVPVLRVDEIEHRPGGAANVALNVVSLGARCTLVGLVGEDAAADELRSTLEAAGVVCDFVPVPDWQTIVKLRLMAQTQQLMRADFESPPTLVGTSERLAVLQNTVEKHLSNASAMVLEDYDKGALEEPQALIHAARQRNVPVLVDPKLKDLAVYRGADVIKPNEREFAAAVGAVDEATVADKAAELRARLELKSLIVTRGGAGMVVADADEVRYVPVRPVEVFDVTGAGDTTAAALAVGMSLGWAVIDAARTANVAASLAVSKLGTAPVSGPELRNALLVADHERGVVSQAALQAAVAAAQQDGHRVVFTNGCFDILHAGHVTYLEEAAALGDRLVVALNSDASVRKLKGAGRPVVPFGGRSHVVAGLSSVDWVVEFDTDTPEALLALLKPDVLVKGGDYQPDEVVGHEIVHGYGGTVQVLTLVEDVSTTAIVEKILKQSDN
ncbi:MAG: bifunctional D-glycero-beta-D-manno-heptose-7-phosphate kinase/D-glycero-beta-D-manno-heptose 1-phosphate adenylyltransferase HldE [Pseudomonadota bacterium]